jgi:hypothetical protein
MSGPSLRETIEWLCGRISTLSVSSSYRDSEAESTSSWVYACTFADGRLQLVSNLFTFGSTRSRTFSEACEWSHAIHLADLNASVSVRREENSQPAVGESSAGEKNQVEGDGDRRIVVPMFWISIVTYNGQKTIPFTMTRNHDFPERSHSIKNFTNCVDIGTHDEPLATKICKGLRHAILLSGGREDLF